MRIGFDAKRLFHNFTGLGNYSRFIVNALHQSYPDNQYILFAPKLNAHSELKTFLELKDFQTITPSRWITKLKLGSAWRSFWMAKEAEREHADIFHGLSHELPFRIPRSIRSVVTIHDLIFFRYPQFYNPIDVAIYKAKVKHACLVADVIVAISQQTADDVRDILRVDPAKIKVVYQGCQPNFKNEFSELDLERIRQKYNLPNSFILTVGTLEPRKNALLILKALKILKGKLEVSLVIIGKPTKYLHVLKDYAQQAGLAGRILYLHDVAFTDLPAIYRLAKIFVYPSLFEGFGIPLVEAIACQTPVITSAGSCFREAAGPHSIYVDPGNEEELAGAIKNVLQDNRLSSEMVSRSNEFITQFEPHVIAKNLMKVYTDVAKRN